MVSGGLRPPFFFLPTLKPVMRERGRSAWAKSGEVI